MRSADEFILSERKLKPSNNLDVPTNVQKFWVQPEAPTSIASDEQEIRGSGSQ